MECPPLCKYEHIIAGMGENVYGIFEIYVGVHPSRIAVLKNIL